MRDAMHAEVAPPDQLAATQLGHSLPVGLEYIECIAVFKVFERDQISAKLDTEVTGKTSGSENIPIVAQPIEKLKPTFSNLQPLRSCARRGR